MKIGHVDFQNYEYLILYSNPDTPDIMDSWTLPDGSFQLNYESMIKRGVKVHRVYRRLSDDAIKRIVDFKKELTQSENEWFLTSKEDFRICRKLHDGSYEFYQINIDATYNRYDISHQMIHPSVIDTDEICECYGYENISHFKKAYGVHYEYDLCNYQFEIDCQNGAYIVNSKPFETWDDAVCMLRRLSGYILAE
ncbi:MAG: hypothetical protein IJO13_11070 [Lachnospiraceae bacterium]|nr:hypothetical protein [Lachnospiraceae bacterium]